MRQITVLGATGSIGLSTLDVVKRHPERFSVFALSANSQIEKLFELCLVHKPTFAVVASAPYASRLQDMLRDAQLHTEVLYGPAALDQVASDPAVDTVMAAIVGAAGLSSSLAAAKAGKRVLLANKETLVAGGALFMDAVAASGAILLPIDSEHNAIYQCLPTVYREKHPVHNGLNTAGIQRLLLTASGGPFRDAPLASLKDVTPEQACAHPNWSMGRKISVDSATMMNKGLEVIEAHWLFAAPAAQIDVVIHPQSIIHSMVEYVDGSVLAQLGSPDMRTPIAYALDYPERIASGANRLDFTTMKSLTFTPPDLARFPCLRLAFEALRQHGAAPAILNAANEVAVAAFLERKLRFTAIAELVESVLARMTATAPASLDDVLAIDAEARQTAVQLIPALAT
ncbi:1-deoxy-D-xylulose-5-phosphate reductoisomerase [Leeia oryzae]|uniref:1-deoxy-D-xylulose-5-phosphate reductoisomerase n=1 Tax=Leeia oryzae TaxID=356662 RepID=UPI00036863D2|nr:1-deoxy-D-xylulose-5-phosphate reductoisomerase [Leeia oryzae]